MRQTIYSILISLFLITCYSGSALSSQDQINSFLNYDFSDLSIYKTGIIPHEQPVLQKLKSAPVYHIDVTLSRNLKRISGYQEVLYTNTENEELCEIEFHQYPEITSLNYTISNTTINGFPVDIVKETDLLMTRVILYEPLKPGSKIKIAMEFSCRIPQLLSSNNYGQFANQHGVLSLANFNPTLSVYDEHGWDKAKPVGFSDLLHADISFYLVRINAPKELKLVAPGIIKNQQTHLDFQHVTYTAGPIRDFYIAASKRYEMIRQVHGETILESYALPEYRSMSVHALKTAGKSIDFFSNLYGLYPYTNFRIAATYHEALGIEYSAVTAMSMKLYNPDNYISGVPARAMLEGTIAHEVGHQWLYNIVGNNQLKEPWLDEAVTQYNMWRYYRENYGTVSSESLFQSFHNRWNEVERKDLPVGLPSAEYHPDEYSPIIYGKGPVFIRTLADIMTERTYDNFMKVYYKINKWKNAEADFFIKLSQDISDKDLKPLFHNWLEKK